MKLFKIALVVLMLLLNLAFVQPSWADRKIPKLADNPDYLEVTQGIDNLLKSKAAPDQSGLAPEEIEQQLGNLRLQKYILETAKSGGQCSNETGKTLGVYAHKPKKSNSSQVSTFYFLGNGETTDDEWDCDGIYLPSGTKIAGLTTDVQELNAPVAFKIVDGTKFVAKTNSETGAVEFNLTPAGVFQSGEGSWAIPNFLQADIEAQTPNAPIED